MEKRENMKFTKMHGLGNDFVVIDAVNQTLPEDLEGMSRRLADRHFGVGCDQVLLVCPSEIADFKMLIFNNDGGEVEMCGNGIRCLARFVYDHKMTDRNALRFSKIAEYLVARNPERYRKIINSPELQKAISENYHNNKRLKALN